MKTPLLFIFLSLGSFVIADQNAEFHCNLENYQDFISKLGVHECHLLGANLTGADLRGAKVTQKQAVYLYSQGLDLSGLVVQ